MHHRKFAIMTAFLVAAGVVGYGLAYLPEAPIRDADLSALPYAIGGWKGENTNDDTVPDLSKRIYATHILYRIYRKEGSAPITVFVSSCRSLKKHPNFKFHFPMYCYVGSGWKIAEQRDIPVPAAGASGGFHVRELFLHKDESRLVTIFYFQTRRTVKMTPGIGQRIQDLLNRCLFRRSDITVVRLSSPIIADDVRQTTSHMLHFLQLFEPVLTRMLAELG